MLEALLRESQKNQQVTAAERLRLLQPVGVLKQQRQVDEIPDHAGMTGGLTGNSDLPIKARDPAYLVQEL